MIGFIILIVIGLIVSNYDIINESLKTTKTKYCNFQKNITDRESGLQRYECIQMAIITKDMNSINFSQFESLNQSTHLCVDKYQDLPECFGERHFSNKYPMSLFGEIDGTLCTSNSMTYYGFNNSENIKMYEYAFMQNNYSTSEEMNQGFLKCNEEGRQDE